MRCVDKDGRIVDDAPCQGTPSGAYLGGHYRWYYGGQVAGTGKTVSGGSYAPQAGTRYTLSTTRGGFGRSAGIHSSFGSA